MTNHIGDVVAEATIVLLSPSYLHLIQLRVVELSAHLAEHDVTHIETIPEIMKN